VEESGDGKSVLGGWPWRGGGEWRWGRLWPLLDFSSTCPSLEDRDEVGKKKEQDNVTRHAAVYVMEKIQRRATQRLRATQPPTEINHFS
jgi:hypothetical protein